LKPEKIAINKKRKSESLLSTEINRANLSLVLMMVSIRSAFLFLLNHLVLERLSSKKSSHPTTELVVSLIINHEEHLIRALADTAARSSIILEAYTKAPFINNDDSNTTTWITMGGNFTTTKAGICL
jgi:hypothetical protein